MPELKHSFQAGKMNKDLDERIVPNGEYRDALNIEITTSEDSDVGTAQTTMGNIAIPSTIPQGNQLPDSLPNKCIGSVTDDKDDNLYWFIAGPEPVKYKKPSWQPFVQQKNYISYDIIARSNGTNEEPVLVDIYSVGVGLSEIVSQPGRNYDQIKVADISGLRVGMELYANWSKVLVQPPQIPGQQSLPYFTFLNIRDRDASPMNGLPNYLNPPTIISITPSTPGQHVVTLNAPITLVSSADNNRLVFGAPRVLNFDRKRFITGINIIEDLLFWTDNHTEPKQINISRSVVGCKHPFSASGVPSFTKHTNFVTVDPWGNGVWNYWLGSLGATVRPIKEEHITVIKESPYLTPSLEMTAKLRTQKSEGVVFPKWDQSTSQWYNPFFNNLNSSTVAGEIWISFGGPNTTPAIPLVSGSPDWSIVPYFAIGDTVIFNLPGSSPVQQIRGVVTAGYDQLYGSYKIDVLSYSPNIVWTDGNINPAGNTLTNWTSELELGNSMFEFKFPRFACRYKYEDGEYSSYSPFTEVAFLPDGLPMDYLPKKGYNLNMTNQLRNLAITNFVPEDDLLPDGVKAIEILYKESNSPNVYTVKTIHKTDDEWDAMDTTGGIAPSDQNRGYLKVTSEMIHAALPSNQLLRHWDNVPRKALAQEVTGNRLVYANYLQDYNMTYDEYSSKEIAIDLQLSLVNWTNIYGSDAAPEIMNSWTAFGYAPAKSLKSLRTYKLGVVLRDRYGRETPVFSDSKDSTTIYIDKDKADNENIFTAKLRNQSLPKWVKSYKFFIKETSNEYYNLAMDRWYDAQDQNIWLSFPSSERNKVDEDTFLILKKEHNSDNFVEEKARYKILAIENEAPDFIKTEEVPLGILTEATPTSTTGAAGGVFVITPNNPVTASSIGFPEPGVDLVRIQAGPFEGMGWHDTLIGTWKNNLFIRFGTATLKSDWYKIISVREVASAAEYEIVVERDFGTDMSLTGGKSNPLALTIDIIERKIEHRPEFDGRFFVKVHRDLALVNRLVDVDASAVVTSYQVVQGMISQVIAPQSSWSQSHVVTSTGWDGWGTNPTVSNISSGTAAFNYNTGDSFGTSGSPAAPMEGPDWTMSTNVVNANGKGETYWQAFQNQDSTRGTGSASRWFIDARSGQNEMFQQATVGRPMIITTSIARQNLAQELDNSGRIPGGQNNSNPYPGVIASVANNPISRVNTNDTIPPNVWVNPALSQSNNVWRFFYLSLLVHPDLRFRKYSEGIFQNSAGEQTVIDLSCQGFGGADIGEPLSNNEWDIGNEYHGETIGGTSILRQGINDLTNAPQATKYVDDVTFITALTTPGTLWKWQEDPDQIIYKVQPGQTQPLSIYTDDEGFKTSSLTGYIGDPKSSLSGVSSHHLNTQTMGQYRMMAPSGTNPPQNGWVGGTFAGIDSLVGSNTSFWNRSQRWTFESKTLSGGELGSGSGCWLPTNDPRWSTANTNFGNANQCHPGVRHDGMGVGESSWDDGTTTESTGVVKQARWDLTTYTSGGSFTWQILTPIVESNSNDGSFSSTNPAIWETEPKEGSELDIYYEIGQIYARGLSAKGLSNFGTQQLHIPIGSKVDCYRPSDSTYATYGTGPPVTGVIDLQDQLLSPASNNSTIVTVANWNDFSSAGTGPLDATAPNEVNLKWATGEPGGTMSPDNSIMPGDILTFTRPNGSQTKARVMPYSSTWPLSGPIATRTTANKVKGIYTLDSYIQNSYNSVNKLTLPWFNCYSFGNGIESNRIRDDFNEVTIDKGPKASTTLATPYAEERKGNGLIFSGIYNSKVGVNNLNQFIKAEDITKDLNPTYGSIQKLHSRDTDLITLCEDKIVKVLANKDALYNADGNPQLLATPNVLGQTVSFLGEYGISRNPESFVSESFRAYFTDKDRGAVLRLSRDGLTPISNYGMKDYFADKLPKANELIGSFDTKKTNYNLTLITQKYSERKTISFTENANGWSSFKSFLQEQGFSLNNEYYTVEKGYLWKHHSDEVDRNRYYDIRYDSSITVLFNEIPGSVKSFGTLNYEGSQAKITQDFNDNEYFDNRPKEGWYVKKIETNLQTGGWLEFKDKEDKWFSKIKGETTEWTNEWRTEGKSTVANSHGNVDTSEFSVQGIEKAIEVVPTPCVYGCVDNNPGEYPDVYGNDSGAIYSPQNCPNTITTSPCVHPCASGYAANNFDPCATCQSSGDPCIYPGCMDSTASNYNPLATVDDNSCILPRTGCMDPNATNYCQLCTVDCDALPGGTANWCCAYTGGSCIDSTQGDNPDINGGCTNGNNVGYPNYGGCAGGTGYHYTNYNPNTNIDCAGVINGNDTSCCGACTWGCTCGGSAVNGAGQVNDCLGYGFAAGNYNPLATCDDGSCDGCWYGCTDGTTIIGQQVNSNYDPLATCDCEGPGSAGFPNPAPLGCTTTSNPPCNSTPGSNQCCNTCTYGCMDCGTRWETQMQTQSNAAGGHGCYCNDTQKWDGSSCSGDGSTATAAGADNFNPNATCDDGSCLYNIASWNCINGACIDPGIGNGVYSSKSACQSACTCASPPNPSSSFTSTTATLTWDVVPGVWGYRVRYKVGSGSWILPYTTLQGVNTNSLSLTGLSASSTYYWQVQSMCSSSGTNNSSWTSQQTFTTGTAPCVSCASSGAITTYQGCCDPAQFNYNSLVTCDDGSCIPFIYGCTNPTAINYYPGANVDDGNCVLCTSSANFACQHRAELVRKVVPPGAGYFTATQPHSGGVLTLKLTITQDAYNEGYIDADWRIVDDAGGACLGTGTFSFTNTNIATCTYTPPATLPSTSALDLSTVLDTTQFVYVNGDELTVHLNSPVVSVSYGYTATVQFTGQDASGNPLQDTQTISGNYIAGCMDVTAANFDANAVLDGGNCTYII